MKFLIDESVEKPIVDWLRDQKYDVMYVAESSSGITDEEVIKIANCESRILMLFPKPFIYNPSNNQHPRNPYKIRLTIELIFLILTHVFNRGKVFVPLNNQY